MPVQHYRQHADVHAPFAEWSEEQTLHVAVAYVNPFRRRTVRVLANNFRRWLEKCPNVQMHFGEAAYGERPWELTDPSQNPLDVQFRTRAELFHKENILKRTIQTFPPGWKYGCIIDADFHIQSHPWALETIHQLQHYAFVQPFSNYVDVGGGIYGQSDLAMRVNTGFMFNYINNGFKVSPKYFNTTINPKDPKGDFPKTKTAKEILIDSMLKSGATWGLLEVEDDYAAAMAQEGGVFMRGTGATGGALAFRRDAYDAVGGLMDKCILGHGDWYMSFGLVDVEPPDIHIRGYTDDYLGYIRAWRKRAQVLQKNVGYTDAFAVHYFHGSKTRRAYSSRDLILAKHGFSPVTDIFDDYQGIYQLTPDKPAMRDDIRQYFISRQDDDPTVSSADGGLVGQNGR